jgi:hypothetical protein
MSKRILEKAEVVLECHDKFRAGTCERSARYDAHFDERGVSLTLHRIGGGENKKTVHMHLSHGLFVGILRDLAKTVSVLLPQDAAHRDALLDAARGLCRSLHGSSDGKEEKDCTRKKSKRKDVNDLSQLTPQEQVLLLHILE